MIREQRFRQVAVGVAAVFTLGAVTAFGVAPLSSVELPAQQTLRDEVALAIPPIESVDRFIQTERVRRGDSLASLLARLGAIDPEFQQFVSSDAVARKVLQLRAGRTVLAEVDSLGRVTKFSYRLGSLEDNDNTNGTRPGRRVLIEHNGERFVATEGEVPLERSLEVRTTEIRSSLFAATDAAGIPDGVAAQVADVLGGDVDFQRDLRKGDQLRVVYESVREAGSFDQPAAGRLLAVEFINGAKRHEAMWFDRDDNGPARGEYYDFSGRSLKKSFLRNPLEFTRVTSGFTESRMHPIMRDWRAHKGVDFAAPIGTKVRSVADGTVEFLGSQRGYGNVLMIKHNPTHTTVYAHLNDFADGLRVGSQVGQGDVIGFVGQTGWATGPHLHYEFRVNGEQADPMTIALPQGQPIEIADRAAFTLTATSFRAQISRFEAVRVARFE